MSVVDEKTTEILGEIEETWIEVKRRTRTQAARGRREQTTDDPDLRQVGRVEDVPAGGSQSDKVDDVMRRILNSGKSNKSDVY